MKSNVCTGLWVNEFLRQIVDREFNLVLLDRKTLATLADADYWSLCRWLDNRGKVSADKLESLIQRLPLAAFKFFQDFQASMRTDPAQKKPVELERAEVSKAQAEFDGEYAIAVVDGLDEHERQQLRMKGSILAAETAEFVQAIVA